FTDDDWKVPPDPTRQRGLPGGGEMHHPLAKPPMGNLWARSEGGIRPPAAARTALISRGGLASPKDFGRNPAFGLAKAAYYEGVKGYFRDFLTNIADERKGKPARAMTDTRIP